MLQNINNNLLTESEGSTGNSLTEKVFQENDERLSYLQYSKTTNLKIKYINKANKQHRHSTSVFLVRFIYVLYILNFHFFAKVWSLKLLAKNFARDVNALAKVLRMSSARRTAIKSPCAKRGPLYVCT
jgi:hypothetical protein